MKKIILVPALLGVMGIGGIITVAGGNIVGSADTSKILTKTEIEKKALAEVKGRVTEIEFETEGLMSVYEVDVVTAETEYDLKFNALTGELLKKTKDDHHDDRNSNSNTSTYSNTSPATNTSVNTNGTTQAPPVSTHQNQSDDSDDWYDDDRYDDDRYDDDFEDDDDD